MITSEAIQTIQSIVYINCFIMFTYSYVKKDIYGLVFWGILCFSEYVNLQ